MPPITFEEFCAAVRECLPPNIDDHGQVEWEDDAKGWWDAGMDPQAFAAAVMIDNGFDSDGRYYDALEGGHSDDLGETDEYLSDGAS